MTNLPTVICMLVCISLAASPVSAHPFAVTSTEVEFNDETRAFEVAMRVYPEQLEQALRKETGRSISLEQSTDIDNLILRYLSSHFSIRNGTVGAQPTTQKSHPSIRWIGKEVTPKSVWLYFEVPFDGSLQGLIVTNSMFFRISPEQLHSITMKANDRVASCTLSRSEPESLIHWNSRKSLKFNGPDRSLRF